MKKQWIQLDVEAASGPLPPTDTVTKGCFHKEALVQTPEFRYLHMFATYKRLLVWTPTRHIPLTDLLHFTDSYFPPEAILAARKILMKQQGFGK